MTWFGWLAKNNEYESQVTGVIMVITK